ncbi:hypothetical protein [Candidatus Igneacidithiobacillus taiwanensis]|uniref:hypothetical protein n=1 Tax=Candidatus Igneacidithiobacillus taiwanensis TaxID=1945924 RepID=UPI00289630B6|nr:hypothetical protein [Candidatus Igneacidithiobacillus taiwanensis]
MKVTIKEAARLGGVSRATLYRKYINTGVIVVERDRDNRPIIDTSELLRVFGEMSHETRNDHAETDHEHVEHDEKDMEIVELRGKLEGVRDVLRIREEELKRALEQIDWLQKRLEASEQKFLIGPETKRRWWWPW